jgi:hypothetical protein
VTSNEKDDRVDVDPLELGRMLAGHATVERAVLEATYNGACVPWILDHLAQLTRDLVAHEKACTAKTRPCGAELAIMGGITMAKEILAKRLLTSARPGTPTPAPGTPPSPPSGREEAA